MTQATTVSALLTHAERRLGASDSARLDAEILLGAVMQVERANLYAHPDTPVTDERAAAFHDLVAKRREGYPVAYLMGTREFWSLELIVNETTLIPRPETECLVAEALQMIPRDSPCRVLDLGTGSGAIAIAIANERPLCRITATDISVAALKVATRNAKAYGCDNITFVQSDWYRQLDGGIFDLIVSNPPYIRRHDPHLSLSDVRFEPPLALVSGADGLRAIKRILNGARAFLTAGGAALLEHGATQAAAVRRVLNDNDFKRVATRCDLARLERVTYGYR